jgi:hypothetical protein
MVLQVGVGYLVLESEVVAAQDLESEKESTNLKSSDRGSSPVLELELDLVLVLNLDLDLDLDLV